MVQEIKEIIITLKQEIATKEDIAELKISLFNLKNKVDHYLQLAKSS